MALSEYPRGATIGFSTTFTDQFGAASSPSAANVKIRYRISGNATSVTVAMTVAGATATASWSSTGVDAGKVDWFISTTGAVISAAQGSFMLVANAANT